MTELECLVREKRKQFRGGLVMQLLVLPIVIGACLGGAPISVLLHLVLTVVNVKQFEELQSAERKLALNPPPAPLPTTIARYRSARAGRSSAAD